jgi:hypothetical protein
MAFNNETTSILEYIASDGLSLQTFVKWQHNFGFSCTVVRRTKSILVYIGPLEVIQLIFQRSVIMVGKLYKYYIIHYVTCVFGMLTQLDTRVCFISLFRSLVFNMLTDIALFSCSSFKINCYRLGH